MGDDFRCPKCGEWVRDVPASSRFAICSSDGLLFELLRRPESAAHVRQVVGEGQDPPLPPSGRPGPSEGVV